MFNAHSFTGDLHCSFGEVVIVGALSQHFVQFLVLVKLATNMFNLKKIQIYYNYNF